ncbi:hypothetical protein D3C72_2563080 [compost metagenome]
MDPHAIREHALKFSNKVFQERLGTLIEQHLSKRAAVATDTTFIKTGKWQPREASAVIAKVMPSTVAL